MKYLLIIFLLISTVSCNNILVLGPKTPEIKKVFSELKCEILKRLSPDKLRTVKTILQSFFYAA